jgi:hypothetical protein
MTTTPPAPTEEPNLRVSALRNVGGAVGLVVLVAALFGAIGMVGRADTPTPIAADGPASDPATEAPDAPDEAEATEESAPDDTEEPDAEPEATDGAEDVDADADETGTAEEAEPEPAVTEEPEAEPEPSPEPTEDQPAAAGIPPGDISIQVLDGYKTDGGTAARGIAASLRDDGYRVIAENQALSYDRTAVLWTEGNEAAARQVAAAIGAAEVREQPGNLSSAVDVHVVVGADRG